MKLCQLGRSSRVVLLLSTCLGVVLSSAFARGVQNQGHEDDPSVHSDQQRALAFEVISIRPSKPGEIWHLSINPNGDQYVAAGLPLGNTILSAFFPFALQRRERLSGVPGWVWNDRFDFVAKVAPEDIQAWHESLRRGFGEPNPMLEAMLQAALADRCRLRVHRIPATVPGLALVVANHGPNRKRFSLAKRDEIIPGNAIKIAENGRMVPILSTDDPTLHFYATSTVALAAQLSRFGAPVEDRTGLTGIYDFSLVRLSTNSDPSVDWDIAALGLKLIPIKIPTENIVVDHIEHPSPN